MKEALRKKLEAGQNLFNEGRFFESHESFEEVWMGCEGKEKILVQGLVQAAAGFHKLKTGQPEGTLKLLKRALAKLKQCPEEDGVRQFTAEIDGAVRQIESGAPARAPRMEIET